MKRVREKTILKRVLRDEIPEIDFSVLQARTLGRIRNHEEKKRQQELYFLPKIGLNLLLVLLAINIFGIIEEGVYTTMNVMPSLAQGFSLGLIKTPILHLLDNALIIGINLTLIVLLHRRFMGAHRVARMFKKYAYFIRDSLMRIPTAAWALVRRS